MADNYTKPIKNPVIPISQDQESINWLANWLNNRRQQLYNNAKNSYQYNVLNKSYIKNDLNSPNYHHWNLGGIFSGLSRDRLYTNKVYYTQLNNAASASEFIENPNIPSDFFVTQGSYVINDKNNYGHYIKYPGFPTSDTKLHERTHAMQAHPQERAILNIISGRTLHSEYTPDTYLDDPSEVYSRMMEFRYKSKIAPNKVVTKELLDKNRGLLRKYNLDRYTDDTLIKLFNEVAYTPENNQEDILRAFYGAKLNKKDWFK